MKKYESWVTSLYVLVFIATPSVAGLFLVLDQKSLPYFYMWIIAIGVIVGSFLLTYVLFKLKVLTLSTFAFAVPLSIVMGMLYIARDLPWWAMFLLAIVGVLTAFPVNIVVTNVRLRYAVKHKDLLKKNLKGK